VVASLGTARAIQRRGQLGVENITGEQRSRGHRLPKATRSSAKELGEGGEAHQGLGVAGAAAEEGRRRRPAAEMIGCSLSDGHRRTPGL
jgi:hypothetical protein